MGLSTPLLTVVVCHRGDVLIIGGDLAYPNPSNETYETRFFRPYEAALPSPPHVTPGSLVVQKPDLPALQKRGGTTCHQPPSSLCDKHAAAYSPDAHHRQDCRWASRLHAASALKSTPCAQVQGLRCSSFALGL